MTAEYLGAIIAAIGLAGAAIYQAGALRGRFDRHEQVTEKRLDQLEAINGGRITREELDARFDALKGQLDAIATMLNQLLAGR